MNTQFGVGIAAAIFAAFAWSLNFIAPYAVGPYSTYDLAVCRFLMSGLLGLLVFWQVERRSAARPGLRDWAMAAWLGLIGYVGYFLTIMGAVLYAGPVIPPAFVALVPVVLAIVGNRGQGQLPWRALALPLGLALVGLLLVNVHSLDGLAHGSAGNTLVGIVFSIAAVALWTLFGVTNQAALRQRPQMDARTWTALMMVGGALEIALFIPVGLALGLFRVPQLGLGGSAGSTFLLFALALALLGSIAGSWAWTIASQRLPIGLAGQLIATETIFATTFGLLASQRWPAWYEAAGVALLLLGVVVAIGVFHRQQSNAMH